VRLALIGKVLGFVGEEFGEGLEALGDSKAGYLVFQSIHWNQGEGGVSLVELGKDALGLGPDIKAGVAAEVGEEYDGSRAFRPGLVPFLRPLRPPGLHQ